MTLEPQDVSFFFSAHALWMAQASRTHGCT